MTTTHVGLVKIKDNKIVRVNYILSKFERELGDKMTIEGCEMVVAVIANDRNDVVITLNTFIKKQNAIIRKQQKIEDAKFWSYFIKKNDIKKYLI